MKRGTIAVLLTAAALAGGAGWRFLPGTPPAPAPPEAAAIPWRGPPPTRTLTDAAAIFKKAFRREPGAGDQIRHAERHEWSDSEGITKWAWFLEVDASPDLWKYLREDNAFGLVRTASHAPSEERPAWFTFDGGDVSVLTSLRGNMRLIFLNGGNRLFATDSGAGLQRGAPGPVPAESSLPREAPVPGRLPTTSPPKPSP